MRTTAASTLRRAANYIQKHGWCRRVSRDARGRVCAQGAINVVTDHLRHEYDARESARHRLVMYLGINRFEITQWNDKPSNSGKNVIRALRAAARKK